MLLVAGSMFSFLKEASTNPSKVISTIGTSLPSIAALLVSSTLLSSLACLAKLLCLTKSLKLLLLRLCFDQRSLTRNALLQSPGGPFAPTDIDYSVDLPDCMFILNCVLIYSAIAPIILPAGAMCFAVLFMICKYQFVFVFTRSNETGGKFWYDIYHYSICALMATVALNIAYMSVKQGFPQTVALLHLPLIILYAWRYTEQHC